MEIELTLDELRVLYLLDPEIIFKEQLYHSISFPDIPNDGLVWNRITTLSAGYSYASNSVGPRLPYCKCLAVNLYFCEEKCAFEDNDPERFYAPVRVNNKRRRHGHRDHKFKMIVNE